MTSDSKSEQPHPGRLLKNKSIGPPLGVGMELTNAAPGREKGRRSSVANGYPRSASKSRLPDLARPRLTM
jgi:hypothetical protein